MWFKFLAFCSNLLRQLKQEKANQKQFNLYHTLVENIAAYKTTQCNTSRILVVKLDDIGDYILFENAFHTWATSQQINQELFLVGNEAWRPLFELKFKELAITCCWVNKSQWLHEQAYQKEKAKELQSIAPSTCMYPSYTRSLLLDASIGSLFPNAAHIGLNNPKNTDQQLEKAFLTEKINPPKVAHELELNACFFKQVIPAITEAHLQQSNYFIVGIGGNQQSKRWSEKKYGLLIQQLLMQFPKFNCLIVGGKAEQEQAKQIVQQINNPRCINYCEQVQLEHLANFCMQAQFAICNDTAVAHVCALNNVPLLVVANGNRYGRFFPYPKSFKQIRVIYPSQLKPTLSKHYDWKEKFPINAIKYTDVLAQLHILLDSCNN